MAQTNYEQYVEKRRKNLTKSGQIAQEVFGDAYELSAALLEIRKLKKLTQLQLSKRTGIQQGDISRIENGNLVPTASTFLKLLHGLDVTVSLNVHQSRHKSRTPKLKIKKLAV